MTACTFAFDQRDKLYFSGDTVRVLVILTTTTTLETLQEVCIHFYGGARASFLSEDDVAVYLDQKDIVYRRDNSSPLPAGTHQFFSTVELPANLASSWHDTFGSVEYACHVNLIDTDGTVNKFTENFSVVRALSLPLDKLLRYSLPASFGFLRKLYCANLPQGTIHTKIKLPRRLFMCEEDIPFTITITNDSSVAQSHLIIVELEQEIKYTIGTVTQRLTHDVAALRIFGVGAARTQDILEETLQIPVVTPTSLDGPFRISYTLNVFVYALGRRKNRRIHFPLAIGVMKQKSPKETKDSGCCVKYFWRRCLSCIY